jgi:hypothetical protein
MTTRESLRRKDRDAPACDDCGAVVATGDAPLCWSCRHRRNTDGRPADDHDDRELIRRRLAIPAGTVWQVFFCPEGEDFHDDLSGWHVELLMVRPDETPYARCCPWWIVALPGDTEPCLIVRLRAWQPGKAGYIEMVLSPPNRIEQRQRDTQTATAGHLANLKQVSQQLIATPPRAGRPINSVAVPDFPGELQRECGKWYRENGSRPTQQNIADKIGVTLPTFQRYLRSHGLSWTTVRNDAIAHDF